MEVATIYFTDRDSGDEGVAVVRAIDGTAGLALSLRKNGDIDVYLGAQELDQLMEALQRARGLLSDTKA